MLLTRAIPDGGDVYTYVQNNNTSSRLLYRRRIGVDSFRFSCRPTEFTLVCIAAKRDVILRVYTGKKERRGEERRGEERKGKQIPGQIILLCTKYMGRYMEVYGTRRPPVKRIHIRRWKKKNTNKPKPNRRRKLYATRTRKTESHDKQDVSRVQTISLEIFETSRVGGWMRRE